MSLLQGTAHTANIRARTDIEVLVMGKHVFEKTNSIKPFRKLIEETIKRRGVNIWQKMPLLHDLLEQKKVTDILEPVKNFIDGERTFEEILEIFNDTSIDFCCILNNEKLEGVITRSDIFRAIETGATRNSKVSDCMVKDPIAIEETDTALTAASTMKEHGIRRLFIVNNFIDNKLTGYIRAEKLLYITMKSL